MLKLNVANFQSLKKEVDWDRMPDDKSCGESSSEYRHSLHESVSYLIFNALMLLLLLYFFFCNFIIYIYLFNYTR